MSGNVLSLEGGLSDLTGDLGDVEGEVGNLSAAAVQASAEALPFDDHSFDAAMAIFSDHHWADRSAGLREMRRVARRVVIFNADPALAGTA